MVKTYALTAAALAAVSFNVFAQVEVVDLSVPSTRTTQANNESTYQASGGGKPSPASMTEFYFQLQSLQNEVQTLRGLVEEQSYELKKLKQQRLDDYLDVDRRLSQLTQSGAATKDSRITSKNVFSSAAIAPLPSPELPSSQASEPMTSPDSGEDELTLYRSGIDAVLKSNDEEKAIDVFSEYIQRFPEGVYAANSKYWLAQVYLRRDDYPKAEQWFRDLIVNHPTHQKTPEAQFKLGKVLHLQGKNEEAKAQLKKVAVTDSAAAKLAQDYLKSNF